jgi:hypothetical protein
MRLFLPVVITISSICAAVTVPDFNVTDLAGNAQHLYSYLDQGMYAVLCFSMPQTS